jgi:hypothetical protein
MATNNATDTSKPVTIAQGGTGASSMATTDGMVYYNGTDLVVTSAGTVGYPLTSNGSGAAPTYQISGATGTTMVFLGSQTVSSSTASVQFYTADYPAYQQYYFIFSNVVPVTSTAVLQFNGTTTGSFPGITSNYTSGFWSIPSGSSTVTNANSTSTIILSGPLSTTAGLGAAGFIDGISNYYNGSYSSLFWCSGNCVFNGSTSGLNTYGWFSTGNPASTVNGFQFIMSTGNIATGTFSFYGVGV